MEIIISYNLKFFSLILFWDHFLFSIWWMLMFDFTHLQYCTCLPIFVHIRGNFDWLIMRWLIVSVRGEGELGLIPTMEGLNLKHQSRGRVLTWPPSCMGCKQVQFQANSRNWTCDLLIEAKRPLPLSQIGAKQEFNVFPLQSFMSVLIVSLYIYLLSVLLTVW